MQSGGSLLSSQVQRVSYANSTQPVFINYHSSQVRDIVNSIKSNVLGKHFFANFHLLFQLFFSPASIIFRHEGLTRILIPTIQILARFVVTRNL
jgi:hypothetical protein